jgi:hypothetical protein
MSESPAGFNFDGPTQVAMQHIAETAAETAIETVFTKYGFDIQDPTQMQRDMAHLRRWRVAVEGAQTKGFMAIVTILVGGLAGVLWLGFKTSLGKG